MRISPAQVREDGPVVTVSASIEIDGKRQTLWYSVEREHGGWLTPDRQDAFVVALLPVAMTRREDLHGRLPVGPTVIVVVLFAVLPFAAVALFAFLDVRLVDIPRLYIDNLVDAFMLAEMPDRGLGQAYLIADEHYVEIEDLVRRVAQAMGTRVRIPHYPVWPLVVVGHIVEKACKPFGIAPPIFPRRVDWFRLDRAFDIGKAKRELGYQPAIGLDEGLRRTVDFFREAYA